jgi:hypothetical protein
MGRRAIIAAERSDKLSDLNDAIEVLARIYFCRGESSHARPFLTRLFGMRHTENGHIRYAAHLLLGDYHLAVAREAAGCTPVDDTLPKVKLQGRSGRAVRTAVDRSLTHARRAYRAALQVGIMIDEQLECKWRQEMITSRMERCKALQLLCSG